MPSIPRQATAGRVELDSRDQARRLPDHGPARCRRVRLFTRNGHDFTARFPFAAAAVAALPGRSFVIDGEAIVTDDKGLAVFDLVRRARHGEDAVLCAFDLIELDGEDLRRKPIEDRKRTLSRLIRTPRPGIVLNEHY
ncbi:MAG: hypothetical protein WBG15_14985, partial [Xanthobacteraceae bacterium]